MSKMTTEGGQTLCVVVTSRGKPSTTMFPTLVASPQTPDRTEEIIAGATLWTRQRGEKLR